MVFTSSQSSEIPFAHLQIPAGGAHMLQAALRNQPGGQRVSMLGCGRGRAQSPLSREGPAGRERQGTRTSVRITVTSLVSCFRCPRPPPDRPGRGLWLWHPLVLRRPSWSEEDLRGGGQHHGPARGGERGTGSPAGPRPSSSPIPAWGAPPPRLRGAWAQLSSVSVSHPPNPLVGGLAGPEGLCPP